MYPARELAFDCADGDAELGADRFLRKSFHFSEENHFAATPGQRGQSVGEQRDLFPAVKFGGNIGSFIYDGQPGQIT